MAEEDEDVVLAGSALHRHLLESGLGDVELSSPASSDRSLASELAALEERDHTPAELLVPPPLPASSNEPNKRLTSVIWPDTGNKILEVELAQEIVKSELLVSEDEDFINNFILSEDTLEEYKKAGESGGSVLGDVLLFSGSLAAVAGAVFFLSERTRLAATAAAILPSALATASSVRLGARVQQGRETKEFQDLVKQMLSDMKIFKQLLRKSLNLIQGMEMMNQGYMQAFGGFGPGGGNGPVENGENGPEGSSLSAALCKRSSFIALRRAIYSSTIQITTAYRAAIQTLMEVCPLAEHIDLKDHYLAFIELENFGISSDLPDERLSVRQLKDTIQLSLLQQSEYLRRFSLTFCEKALHHCDKVREDEKMHKAGVLKHVKEIISKIRTVSDKLGNILEYHQALGLVPLPELEQRALSIRRQSGGQQVKRLLPLRTVYTSLFSTGLHLQNSLMKVRHLEGFFDSMEKRRGEGDSLGAIMPDEKQLLEWLQNFKEIQTELNSCLTCLEDGVTEIDTLGRPSSSRLDTSGRSEASDLSASSPVTKQPEQETVHVIDEKAEVKHMDEVFEAFISARNVEPSELGFEDDFISREEVERCKASERQSKRVVRELKSVLVGKQKEWERREARAMARQQRVDLGDGEHHHHQREDQALSDAEFDWSRLTQDDDSSEVGINGQLCSNGLEERLMDNGCEGGHLLVRSTEGYSENGIEVGMTNTTEDVDGVAQGQYEAVQMSHLEIPRSLYSSNILGLSQETDSDAESIRSDTNTIKTGSQDHIDRVHAASSGDEESHCSDSEVGHGRAAFLPRVEALSAMTRSCREGGRSPRSPREGRKGSTDDRGLDEEELGDRRAALLRSFSTPDFKLSAGHEDTSPYVSLEKLLDQEEDYPHSSASSSSSSPSSSPTSSSPSSSHELVGGNHMFKRPPRAAALRRGVHVVKPVEADGCSNQGDGRLLPLDASSSDVNNKSDEAMDASGRKGNETPTLKSSDINRAPDSTYMRKQTEAVQVNRQPVGFDAGLAAAVASRALGGQEETFGGSDSEDESSSSTSSSEGADF